MCLRSRNMSITSITRHTAYARAVGRHIMKWKNLLAAFVMAVIVGLFPQTNDFVFTKVSVWFLGLVSGMHLALFLASVAAQHGVQPTDQQSSDESKPAM